MNTKTTSRPRTVGLLVTALLAAWLFSGCEQRSAGIEVEGAEGLDAVRLIEVDRCEYIWVQSGYGGGLSHKGNCRNSIHNCPCDTLP